MSPYDGPTFHGWTVTDLQDRLRELETRVAAIQTHEIHLNQGHSVDIPRPGDIKIVVEGLPPRIYDFDGEGWKERASC